ncbi:MAG: cytochrome C oxidase subunit IV family protein [Pyrinomonadaceae bacterium]|nr:cytochrome C oxidase subunit IV family protein [Pyrinomonadaceae bacterium]MDQ3586196.1 cytochrome C oxidase subunit IV family protein [Acidobacteriota bacterium]
MSSRLSTISNLWKKQDFLLNFVCLIIAAGFLLLAVSNLSWAGDFLTIDSLFMMAVCLLLAGVFLFSPALWAYENGLFKRLLDVDDPSAAAPAEPIHFAGSTKLFLSVLGALLGLTLVEVFLAYVEVGLTIMLTILIGLSLIKAVLILAYFMHLRYERLSLILTLVPMLVICICLFFIFFPDGFRVRNLRPY